VDGGRPDSPIVPAIEPTPVDSGPRASLDHDTFVRLCRSRDYLAAHCHDRITLDSAARSAHLSPFHFQRLFVRAFGESPLGFLTRLRIEKAKRLLAADAHSVTAICFEVGYASLGSFSSRFRALVGVSPSEYRRALRRSVAMVHLWRPVFVPYCFIRYALGGEGSQDPRSPRSL
jgi:AraC-like DNA-binding protein